MESVMFPSSLELLIALDQMDRLHKYEEVITRRPRDVSALLRSSYCEGNLTETSALLMLIMDAIHDRRDQLKEYLLGGLHNMFVDILTDHTVYTLQVSQPCVSRRDADADAQVVLHLMLEPTSGLSGRADICSCRHRVSTCRRATRSAHGGDIDR